MDPTPAMPEPSPDAEVTDLRFYGLTASPFQLKMQALADAVRIPWQRLPDQARSRWAARRQFLSLNWAKWRNCVRRYPALDPLDEYPSVPFYRIGQGDWYFDSTGFADHLDALDLEGAAPLLPSEPLIGFLARLIDEAFDEFGLYMVHHMRWAGTKRSTEMPAVTAYEMRTILPSFLQHRFRTMLAARQSRRCPYLFSVAPEGFDLGLTVEETPPAMAGFPETHTLLNKSWRLYLAAMEGLLQEQPFLLGDRFTVADASAYGQLSMNLIDGAPAELLRELAPATHDWLCAIRDAKHKGAVSGSLYISSQLNPLLNIIGATFVPLMRQNSAAYERYHARGETLFNERAFDNGKSLYEGELLGYPFRSVVKTFQVRVWRDLERARVALPKSDQKRLEFLLHQGSRG